jgi:hypothetical protein
MGFERCALGLKDVMTEHVADSASAFAFERTEHVVELKRARKECSERFPLSPTYVEVTDRTSEQPE